VVELFFHFRVAPAYALFQYCTIRYGDFTAAVLYQSVRLQFAGGLGHALPAYAQHICDQPLRYQQFIAVQAVQAQQQPAAWLLVQRMVRVAHRGLRHLRNQRLGVTQRQMPQIAAQREFPFQNTQAPRIATSEAMLVATAR
jgi:hypothetical protein